MTNRRSPRTWTTFFLLGVAALAAVSQRSVSAAPLENVPQHLVQPDGQAISALASGDEFYSWIHDERGFVMVLDEEGWWVWAQRVDGRVLPTAFRVGEKDPAEAGLTPGIMPGSRELQERRRWQDESPDPPGVQREVPSSFSQLNNLVVFIRFSDETEFGDAISSYEERFNNTSAGAISMKSYFQAVAYDSLAIDTYFFPPPSTTVVSYQDSQPRDYYRPYHATTNPIGYAGGPDGTERRTREHTLLRSAVDAIAKQVPPDLDLDTNKDGLVDNACFIVRGAPDGWAELLWPHRWVLWSYDVRINGKQVWDYNLNLQSWIEVSVLAHEMFHTLGAPDLYHYDSDYQYLQPVWKWDIMDSTTSPPQHMGAHMKIRYGGWLPAAPVISSPGTYTLNPLTSPTGNVFRVNSTDANQYYVLEYRQKAAAGFESGIPGTGLLVYRIDSRYEGNADGPPEEVYVYRPNGTPTVNGSPGSAHYSADVGRTRINNSTNPSGFLQSGSPGGLSLSGVTAAGATISFTLDGMIVDRQGLGTVTSSPAGINCGSTCAKMFQYGTTVTLYAAPAAGQEFVGWSGACSGSGTCAVEIAGAHMVTATFAVGTPTLSVSRTGTGSGRVTSDPAGIDCGETCAADFDHGTVVTLTASATTGSTFSGWSG
ncbi:MAG TPA: M6 family metalloprotease domain-containing protein, partial [Thermoanaerobaculaceae bacterium]|nr:M6 family metalloprotease domain-containing protein [Thermoanaerobaculaceae bacterium]